ncbi:MAG: LuxR C-terminal-related transcriptional regulator [Alphaproteobacteria bacterium]|uniref:LuxR C-terminal-related transcriptional regulator n=1 Tax=Candidatus Nitrobium versatile TaxID=2884831 RepID=A0A953M0Q6_9BACT|nr:LuxR C-terminal-related transcriptional regulator [Candidatus Nitrobium versatile]
MERNTRHPEAILLYDFLQNTADAVIGLDRAGKICFWNAAAESFFGLSFDQVAGKKCHTIVGGAGMDGDCLCSPVCPIIAKLLHHEIVGNYDLLLRGENDTPVVVNVGTYLTPKSIQKKVEATVFLTFRPIDSYRLIKRLAAESRYHAPRCRNNRFNLTSRETEILELASKGLTTRAIARNLSISEITVRNHFKNIYSKLGVHSRLEAVNRAISHHLF